MSKTLFDEMIEHLESLKDILTDKHLEKNNELLEMAYYIKENMRIKK